MAMSQDVKVALVLATFGLLVLFGLKFSTGKNGALEVSPSKVQAKDVQPSGPQAAHRGGNLVDLAMTGEEPAQGSPPAAPMQHRGEKDAQESPRDSKVQGEGEAQVPPHPLRYTVQAGDTYYSISRKCYGTPSKWTLIFEANKTQTGAAKKLVPGAQLVIPGISGHPEGVAGSPDLHRGDTTAVVEKDYVIQPGDTLSSIAERFLGSSAYWAKIYEANRDVISDPGSLKVGVKIKIPE